MYVCSNFSKFYQYLLLSKVFIIFVLTVMSWYIIVVWTCIALMANDGENLFTCLLLICMSSKKCLFSLISGSWSWALCQTQTTARNKWINLLKNVYAEPLLFINSVIVIIIISILQILHTIPISQIGLQNIQNISLILLIVFLPSSSCFLKYKL